jgi:predicted DNA-binding transcriptional regulator YafY
LVPPRDAGPASALPTLRETIRRERTLVLDYRTMDGRESRRTVWPLAIGFFEGVQLLVAWCELRRDFRHFRIDRIVAMDPGGRMPERRAALLRRWRAETGVPATDDC